MSEAAPPITTTIYRHAHRTPEKAAIILGSQRLSYRLFASLIEAARRHLTERGIAGPGIAVLPEGLLADLWILGLALRSLGLTTLIPPAETHLGSLGLPQIRYVIAMPGQHGPGLDRVCAARGWRFLSVPRRIFADTTQQAAPDPSALAGPFGGHILLTSGTTGAHKMFLVDPASERVHFRHRQETFGLSGNAVFNLSYFGGWTAVGYRLATAVWDIGAAVMLDQGGRRWESFRSRDITHAVVSPPLLSEILSAPTGAFERNEAMRLFATNEVLTERNWLLARERLTSQIYAYVGSTEASSYTQTPIESAEDLRWHRVLPSREVQIVDDEDRILPVGEIAQVRIRLLTPDQGYLDDEAASRRFFRNGYFYPGDLGVFRADGRLALCGRASDVANIRGNKVRTGPIEEKLRQLLGVENVCLLSLLNPGAEEDVHVVIETDKPVDRNLLSAALSAALPDVSRAQVRLMPSLPRSELGKIRRDVLHRMIAERAGAGRDG